MTMTESMDVQAVIDEIRQAGESSLHRREEGLKLIEGYYQELIKLLNEFEAHTKGMSRMPIAYRLFATSLCNICDWLIAEKNISQSTRFLTQAAQVRDDVDELVELRGDCQRTIRRDENEMLLRLLELIDAVKRIQARWESYPTKNGIHSPLVYRLCDKTQNLLMGFNDSLSNHLATYKVERINTDHLVGQYPPFETTKIAFREDMSTSSDIIVARILEDGYQRDNRLLRKVTITVKTQ